MSYFMPYDGTPFGASNGMPQSPAPNSWPPNFSQLGSMFSGLGQSAGGSGITLNNPAYGVSGGFTGGSSTPPTFNPNFQMETPDMGAKMGGGFSGQFSGGPGLLGGAFNGYTSSPFGGGGFNGGGNDAFGTPQFNSGTSGYGGAGPLGGAFGGSPNLGPLGGSGAMGPLGGMPSAFGAPQTSAPNYSSPQGTYGGGWSSLMNVPQFGR